MSGFKTEKTMIAKDAYEDILKHFKRNFLSVEAHEHTLEVAELIVYEAKKWLEVVSDKKDANR